MRRTTLRLCALALLAAALLGAGGCHKSVSFGFSDGYYCDPGYGGYSIGYGHGHSYYGGHYSVIRRHYRHGHGHGHGHGYNYYCD